MCIMILLYWRFCQSQIYYYRSLRLDLTQTMVMRFFVLAKDIDSYLMARHGTIEFLEESDYLGRNYHMFLSCSTPSVVIIWLCSHNVFLLCYILLLNNTSLMQVGSGGPVVDLDGNVIGMVVKHYMSRGWRHTYRRAVWRNIRFLFIVVW
jgi:hypothetical protein